MGSQQRDFSDRCVCGEWRRFEIRDCCYLMLLWYVALRSLQTKEDNDTECQDENKLFINTAVGSYIIFNKLCGREVTIYSAGVIYPTFGELR